MVTKNQLCIDIRITKRMKMLGCRTSSQASLGPKTVELIQDLPIPTIEEDHLKDRKKALSDP